MAIIVIQHGVNTPPYEARICPECKEHANEYYTEELHQAYVRHTNNIHVSTITLAPTFCCKKCGCIWQWYNEKQE